MTMTPLQVDFCYHVAQGNSKQAEILLQKMQDENSPDYLFKGNPSPTVFCLWAAKQSNLQLVLDKLTELYPNHHQPNINATDLKVPVSIEDTVCAVLVPVIKPHLHGLLFSIVNATPQEIRADYAKTGFEIITCAAALRFILSHQAFKDNADDWKKLTTRMLQQLLTLTKDQLELSSDQNTEIPHAAPDTVKAMLKQAPMPSAARFAALFPGLSNPKSPQEVPDTFSSNEENDQENIVPILPKLGASKGYFTSRPLYGRPSARDIGVNLMNATTPVQPPPTPQCVHQSRLHASYDLVAANPLIHTRTPKKGH